MKLWKVCWIKNNKICKNKKKSLVGLECCICLCILLLNIDKLLSNGYGVWREYRKYFKLWIF